MPANSGGKGGGASDVRAGGGYYELYLRDTALMRGLANAQAKLKKFGDFMTGLGAKVATLGTIGAAPLAKTFADFDDAMRLVKATAQASEAEFASLTERALELGRTTSFTAKEVASLMVELARAGFRSAEVEEMTGAVLDLARATGTDATEAAGYMAATLRQFGKGAGEAARVADLLTQTANATFNSVTDLGYALKYAGPVAADLGVSLEDTLAILGGLGNVGIQGEMAGTTLRRLMTMTGAEAEKLKSIFGVAAADAAGGVRPLMDVMGEIFEATKNLPSGDRLKKFNEFFGLLGITGASTLTKAGVSIKEIRAGLEDAGGVARRTAVEMDAGLGGAFRMLTSAVEGAAIALGGSLAPALTTLGAVLQKVAAGVTEWVGRNAAAAQTLGTLVVTVTAGGAALAVLGVALKAAGLALGVLTAGFGLLVSTVAAVFTPLGAVAAAVAAVTAAVSYASGGMEEFRETAEAAWAGVAAAVGKGDLVLAVKIAGAAIRLEWEKVTNWFVDKWESAINAVRLKIAEFADAGVFDAAGAFGVSTRGMLGVPKGPGVADTTRTMVGVEGDARVKAHEAELARLKAEMDALIADATRAVAPPPRAAGGPEVGPMPRDAAARLAAALTRLGDSARGGFLTTSARQQFGGASVEQKQLDVQKVVAAQVKRVAQNTAAIAERLAFK
jgi:TP901 family phage tail tape measure protein